MLLYFRYHKYQVSEISGIENREATKLFQQKHEFWKYQKSKIADTQNTLNKMSNLRFAIFDNWKLEIGNPQSLRKTKC